MDRIINPMIHIIKQNGFYHALGDRGENIYSGQELISFAEKLFSIISSTLPMNRSGCQLEVYFEGKDLEVVRFILTVSPMRTILLEMVSKKPVGKEGESFLSVFGKNCKN